MKLSKEKLMKIIAEEKSKIMNENRGYIDMDVERSGENNLKIMLRVTPQFELDANMSQELINDIEAALQSVVSNHDMRLSVTNYA